MKFLNLLHCKSDLVFWKKKKSLTYPSFYGFLEIWPYKLVIQVIVTFQRGLIASLICFFLVYHMKIENEESAWHALKYCSYAHHA